MNYYQFHIGDYRGATAHLTNEEDLCYRRLLDLYYDKDGELPAISMIARRVRMPEEVVESVLGEFFTNTGCGWRHERADKEIQAFQNQRDAGKKAAEARWGKKCDSDATAMRPQCDRNANPMPTINHKPITNISPLPPKGGEEEEVVKVEVISETGPRIEKTAQKSQVRGGDIAETFRSDTSLSSAQETPHGKVIEDRFFEFWQAYPENRRKNLYRAQSAFSCSLHTLPPQSELLKSLEAFKRSKEWRQDNGKFIPSPETWIAERRWQDAPAFSGEIRPKKKSDINEADAFAWRAETYPESLDVHPTASTFPFKTWPESIRREYLDSRKTNQPQTQAA